METTTIKGGKVVTMDIEGHIYDPGYVVIEGNKIVCITDDEGKIKKYKAKNIIDASDRIVMPGLINTHMHLRPVRGLGDGLSTKDWHYSYADNVSKRMNEEDAYFGAKLAFAEMISTGTTSALGMTIHGDPELQAAKEMGIRARLVPHAEDSESLKKHNKRVIVQGGSEENKARFWLGMESTTFFKKEELAEVRELANSTGARIHTHLSEWQREDTKPLLNSGFLCSDVVLAHCIWLSTADIDALANTHVNVAHNPKSNMKSGSGVAPIWEMMNRKINICIGTDGPLMMHKFDLWEDVRTSLLLQRVIHKDARIIDAGTALRMATINGAKALGMSATIGSLEKGKKADIILINANKIHFTTLISRGKHSNLVSSLVHATTGCDVETVMIDGEVIMEDGKFKKLDIKNLQAKVKRSAERILGEL